LLYNQEKLYWFYRIVLFHNTHKSHDIAVAFAIPGLWHGGKCPMQPVVSTPKLTIKRNDGSYLELEWDKQILTIGRDSANDLIIDHALASRKHARFERKETGYYIHDLKSTNGTLVNGQLIQDTHMLHHQDIIIVADTIITFHDSDATARGPLPPEVLRATQEDLCVDNQAKAVYIKGQILTPPLTVKEFSLLALLYQRKGQVISKEDIAESVWDYDVYDYNAIDALVYRLRQRIEPDTSNPIYLLTQRGFGYKLMTETARRATEIDPWERRA
jgi:DNA-binding winged helix-turn-helix (wHTH) protein